MSNHRYSKFWWQDWHGEPTLEMCSLAARGLWMELLCLAHTGEPYGHVTLGGEPATLKQIAKYARSTEREVKTLLAELEKFNVFDRTADGLIKSRRMVRDGSRSEEGAKAVAKRWGNGNGKHPPDGSPNRSDDREPTTQYSEAEIRDQKQTHSSSSDARPRWGAPGQASNQNLVFIHPSPPDPPEPRRQFATKGGVFASTVNHEPYGEVRSISDQLDALKPPAAGPRPAFRAREPERTVEEQLEALRKEKSA